MKKISFLSLMIALSLNILMVGVVSPPLALAQCFELDSDHLPVEVPCTTTNTNQNPAGEVDPAGDNDSDGVANGVDNCPGVNNPDQANTFGGAAGDACDVASIMDNQGGTKIFPQFDGTYQVYGDCYAGSNGQTDCQHIATFIPCDAPNIQGQSVYLPNPSAPSSTQFILLTLISLQETALFQLNILDENENNVGAPLILDLSLTAFANCTSYFQTTNEQQEVVIEENEENEESEETVTQSNEPPDNTNNSPASQPNNPIFDGFNGGMLQVGPYGTVTLNPGGIGVTLQVGPYGTVTLNPEFNGGMLQVGPYGTITLNPGGIGATLQVGPYGTVTLNPG